MMEHFVVCLTAKKESKIFFFISFMKISFVQQCKNEIDDVLAACIHMCRKSNCDNTLSIILTLVELRHIYNLLICLIFKQAQRQIKIVIDDFIFYLKIETTPCKFTHTTA